MNEKVVVFGSHDGLVGVLSEPSAEERAQGAPAVLMANVGMHARVGPFRIWVELCRSLAAAGFPALRFDLSGMGDSEPRQDTRGELERWAGDLREAVDFTLARTRTDKVVLVSLCSGVDQAHAVALRDPRVVGVVYVDEYAWPTFGFYLRHYKKRLLLPGAWRKFLSRAVLKMAGKEEVGEVYTRDYPLRENWRANVRGLVDRGVQLFFVFTGSAEHVFNHDSQLATLLGDRALARRVELRRYLRADHTFSGVVDRQRFVADLQAWIAARFLPKSKPDAAGEPQRQGGEQR
jgi:pimeloyl-ACP methyl ester carboxylesterase